ncbi:hypothetical protein RIF29_01993 [Crotalaria pallida]|uniref:Uncharacterized protein n=1 Tax=Crotalaria pallida TaxID=3830 RepID=A0AAN9IY46_CROPI
MNLNWKRQLRLYQNIMASGTNSMKIKAMILLAHLSKHAPEPLLAHCIPPLIEILGHNDYAPSLQMAAVYCLKCIACRGEGGLAIEIGRHGAALVLLGLLPHAADVRFQEVLIKCLLVVVTFCNTSRTAVATNGGLEIIIGSLNSRTNNDAARQYLLEILSVLMLQQSVRQELTRLQALRFVVEAAGSGSKFSRERACQSIGLLGVARQTKRTLFELGAVPVLADVFRNGDHTAKLIAGNALGVMTAHVNYIRPVSQTGVIPLYAELLQGHDPRGTDIADDVFCILSVAESNVAEITSHLVRILKEGGNEAKAAAADVTWSLCGYKDSKYAVRSGAIPILVELLGNECEAVKGNVSGAFAQMSYDEEYRRVLANAGAIPILIGLLNDENADIRDNAAEALINYSEDPFYHDKVSDATNDPSFIHMQNRLIEFGESREQYTRSLQWMSAEQLTWIPGLI